MAFNPVRLSPMQKQHEALGAEFASSNTWQVPERYTDEASRDELETGVGICDISFVGKLELRGATFDNAPEVGRWLETESYLLARLTATKFFVLTEVGEELGVLESIQAQLPQASIVNQTAGYAGIRLSGPKSRDLIGKLCAIDMLETEFPSHRALQTSFAKVHTTLLRRDQNELLSYDLFAARPYGAYLWDAVLDAGAGFGIKPFGSSSVFQFLSLY